VQPFYIDAKMLRFAVDHKVVLAASHKMQRDVRVGPEPAGSRRRVFLIVGSAAKLEIPASDSNRRDRPAMGTVKWSNATKEYGSISPDGCGPNVLGHFGA
jgi:hypothetical protein